MLRSLLLLSNPALPGELRLVFNPGYPRAGVLAPINMTHAGPMPYEDIAEYPVNSEAHFSAVCQRLAPYRGTGGHHHFRLSADEVKRAIEATAADHPAPASVGSPSANAQGKASPADEAEHRRLAFELWAQERVLQAARSYRLFAWVVGAIVAGLLLLFVHHFKPEHVLAYYHVIPALLYGLVVYEWTSRGEEDALQKEHAYQEWAEARLLGTIDGRPVAQK